MVGGIPPPGLNDLTLADRDRFVSRFATFPKMLWCYYFPFLICFGGERRRMLWEERHGCLCLYALSQSKSGAFLNLVFPPIGPEVAAALGECVERMRESNPNHTWRIMWLDTEDATLIRNMGDAQFKDKGAEYLYLPSHLDDLSGGRLESVRKAVRRFEKNYSVDIRPYLPEHEPECLELLDAWETSQGARYFRLMDSEYTREALRRYAEFDRRDLTGEVAIIEGKIKAFAFGGTARPGLANAFILKADPAVRGLSHFMKLRQIRGFEDFDLVADAGDLGAAGLRRFKRSFAPAYELPTFSAGNAPRSKTG